MKKTHIIVAYGGISPERAVSIRSGKSVAAAAKRAGFEVHELLVDDPSDIERLDSQIPVLPILHGSYGEDGGVQRQLENKKIPYFGSNSSVSGVCFDKAISRERLLANNLPVAIGQTVSRTDYYGAPLRQQPHVLKVARGGSSIGTYIVRDPSLLADEKVKEVFRLDEKAVVEELIVGLEITVPIFGDRALPVIEIKPPEDAEFDYENKYNGKTAELCPAPSLSEAKRKEVSELALLAHKALGCRHLSRVDIMLKGNGEPVILEVNTMPGMTKTSLFPKSAKVAGMEMPELIKQSVRMAAEL